MSRRTVYGALASTWSLATASCSLDFVALDESPTGTLIEVRSEHVDGLRVEVEVSHAGPMSPSVWIDGERIAVGGPDANGNYTAHFEPLVDPLAPVLDIEVEQLPDAIVSVEAPLLMRTGEASCEADGDVGLPLRLDPIAGDVLSRTWSVVLSEGDGGIATVAQTAGPLPDPVVVPGELMSESIRSVSVSVRMFVDVDQTPYDTRLVLQTSAEWGLPDSCP